MINLSVIRGGQVIAHHIHMLMQVLNKSLKISYIVAIIYFVIISYNTIKPNQAKLYLKALEQSSYQFLDPKKNNFNPNFYLIKNQQTVNKILFKNLKLSGFLFLGCFAVMTIMFNFYGNQITRKKLLKGGYIADNKILRKLLLKQEGKPEISLENIPLPKGSEKYHMLVVGTTGSGKTNCINKILKQLRDQNKKVIIVDTNGEFVSRFYREGKDYMMNPQDTRGVYWDIWEEFPEETDRITFVNALIPLNSNYDSFWIYNARNLLIAALNKLESRSEHNIKNLLNLFQNNSFDEMREFFKNTEVESLLSKDNAKTFLSILSMLNIYIKPLQYLGQKTESNKLFKIKEYVASEDDAWLFINCQVFQREMLKPLISSWFNTAISGLMNLEVVDKTRVWFFIDELASCQKLPSLEQALAEFRKYGGAIVLGTQDIAQIYRIYGEKETTTMISLLNTKLIFRTLDFNSCNFLSKLLGEEETNQVSESISYGASSIRDGVSLHHNSKTKMIVSPTEIANLKDLEAFIKLKGDYPITKILFKYLVLTKISESFIKKIISENTDPNNDDFSSLLDNTAENVEKESIFQNQKEEEVEHEIQM